MAEMRQTRKRKTADAVAPKTKACYCWFVVLVVVLVVLVVLAMMVVWDGGGWIAKVMILIALVVVEAVESVDGGSGDTGIPLLKEVVEVGVEIETPTTSCRSSWVGGGRVEMLLGN